MLYRLLKIIVSIGVRFYYKEVKLINKHNLPETGPCIYIANHPNTLMDAWLLGYVTKTPIYFMAKGTLFSSPLKNKILRSLNMIPINRKGDSVSSGISNQDSFEACYSILEQRKAILIFPEGTSFLERQLRELKTGAARIALEAERRNNSKLNLQIIPLGLNYLNANRFRSKVMVHVGQAIDVKQYVSEFEKNHSTGAKKLTEIFRMRLEHVLVNSSEKETEILAEDLFLIFKSKYIKSKNKGVEGEFDLLNQISLKLEEYKISQPYIIEEIKIILASLSSKLNHYEIRSDFLDRRFRFKMFTRQLLFSAVFLIIGLPVFVFGIIHNYFQYRITDIIVPKMTKEIEYYAPISVLIGLLFYPLCYVTFLNIADYLLGLKFWAKLSYFIAMPLSGLIAYSIYAYYQHISVKWRFMTFLKSDKDKLTELKEEKNKLRIILFE